MEKTCRDCGVTKPATEFYANNQKSDGLSSYCKPCTLVKAAAAYAKKPKRPRPPEGMKKCSRCKEVKEIAAFGSCKATKDGLNYYCRTCSTDSTVAYHKRHPEKHRAYNREWSRANPHKKADIQLKGRLGVEAGTYARMFAAQDGKCAICGTVHPGNRLSRFPVDHCEVTQVVRGLLCSRCNQGIGLLLHDPVRIQSALEYLAKFPGVPDPISEGEEGV